MSVVITQFQDNQILVNNKLVVQDQEGNWIAKIELTQAEHKAFNAHINS